MHVLIGLWMIKEQFLKSTNQEIILPRVAYWT